VLRICPRSARYAFGWRLHVNKQEAAALSLHRRAQRRMGHRRPKARRRSALHGRHGGANPTPRQPPGRGRGALRQPRAAYPGGGDVVAHVAGPRGGAPRRRRAAARQQPPHAQEVRRRDRPGRVLQLRARAQGPARPPAARPGARAPGGSRPHGAAAHAPAANPASTCA